MDLGIPPLKLKIVLESNRLKSRILVWRLAVPESFPDVEAGLFPTRRHIHTLLLVLVVVTLLVLSWRPLFVISIIISVSITTMYLSLLSLSSARLRDPLCNVTGVTNSADGRERRFNPIYIYIYIYIYICIHNLPPLIRTPPSHHTRDGRGEGGVTVKGGGKNSSNKYNILLCSPGGGDVIHSQSLSFQRKCLVTNARERLWETLKSSEMIYFALRRLKASTKRTGGFKGFWQPMLIQHL